MIKCIFYGAPSELIPPPLGCFALLLSGRAGERILSVLHRFPLVADPLCQPMHVGKSESDWCNYWVIDGVVLGEGTQPACAILWWGSVNIHAGSQTETECFLSPHSEYLLVQCTPGWSIYRPVIRSSPSFFVQSIVASSICNLKTWHPCLSPGLNSLQQNAQVCRQVRYHLRHWGWLFFSFFSNCLR